MKEETETRTTEYTYYICEGCGTRFGNEGTCRLHEEQECAKSEKAKAYCESHVGRCEYYIRGRVTASIEEIVEGELGLYKVIAYVPVDINGTSKGDPVRFYFILRNTRFIIQKPTIYDNGYPPVYYTSRAERCESPYPRWGDFNTYGLTGYRISEEDHDFALKEIRRIIAAPPDKQYELYNALLETLQARRIEEDE